jgi:outer membrane protein assembly factor BamB
MRKQGKLVALEAKTGKTRWEITFTQHIQGISYSAHEDLIISCDNIGTVTALHAKDGKIHWSSLLSCSYPSQPVIDEKRNIVVIAGLQIDSDRERGKCFILSLKNGKILLSTNFFSDGLLNTPVLTSVSILISSVDKYLYSIGYNGEIRGSIYLGARIFSDPYVEENITKELRRIWIGTNDAKLYEIDANTQVQPIFLSELLLQSLLTQRVSMDM